MKGAEPLKPRKFQGEFARIMDEIISGAPIKNVAAIITPGGGKSVLPVIAANRLIGARLADFVAWIVPRKSLAEQAESEFVEDRLGFNIHKYSIRWATNDANPCRGHKGLVTLYDAVRHDAAKTVEQLFDCQRGILFLDECHHVKVGSPTHAALKPIMDKAVLTVHASGTVYRWDGCPAAGFVYDGDGQINFGAPGWRSVSYTRQEALRDRAKIPIEFAHADGAVRWLDCRGDEQEVETLRTLAPCQSDALMAALKTEYAEQLVGECLESFVNHKRFANKYAKMLVVTCSIKEAKRITALMRSQDNNVRVGIAVCKMSGEGFDSRSSQAIASYKRFGSGIDILVTVYMAYEGLDVPSITHIACLTHVRSWPWIEQMFDRGTRVDYRAIAKGIGYESQRCKIWLPDDAKMVEAMEMIRSAQPVQVGGNGEDEFETETDPSEPQGGPGGGGDPPPVEPTREIVPLAGVLTDTRFSGEYGENRILISSSASCKISEVMAAQGCAMTPFEFVTSCLKLGVPVPPEFLHASPACGKPEAFHLSRTPPSVEATRLRIAIQEYATRVDRVRGWRLGTTNGIIKAQFGKPRDEMGVPELKVAWSWVQKHYPAKDAQ
jgi:superfamily II DNA or RNA helicase